MPQGGNMPILLKTWVECTAKTPLPRRRARVGGLCGFQDTVERVPHRKPENRTLRRCTGALAENIGTGRDGRGKSRLRQMREHAETGKIERFWTPRRESGEKAGEKAWRFSAPTRPLLPAVRAVSGDENGAFLRLLKME